MTDYWNEGELVLEDDRHYWIRGGTTDLYFSSGDLVEIRGPNGWEKARFESAGGRYFLMIGDREILTRAGMRVRIPQNYFGRAPLGW